MRKQQLQQPLPLPPLQQRLHIVLPEASEYAGLISVAVPRTMFVPLISVVCRAVCLILIVVVCMVVLVFAVLVIVVVWVMVFVPQISGVCRAVFRILIVLVCMVA